MSRSDTNEKKVNEAGQTPWKTVLSALHHVITHNLWMKVLAVAISLVLWAGLISQDETLTREKTFNDVNVSITNSDTMRRNGYIVTSDLEAMLSGVSVTAAVPQKQYETAEASVYNVRVDLSKINGTGTQELRLLSTNSTNYGKVLSTSPATVQVEVEEYYVRQRIPVSVSVGKVPDEWYLAPLTVDPTILTISGPKSVVETISRARAFLDPDAVVWEEGDMMTSVSFELYNRSAEPVHNSLMTVTNGSTNLDSVLVISTILPTKTLDVTELIDVRGAVAKGYEIKDVRISPETIKVAATQDVLEQMTEIPLDSRTVNVKGLKETTVVQLKVQKPSEDAVLSNDIVTVTVEIGPIDD